MGVQSDKEKSTGGDRQNPRVQKLRLKADGARNEAFEGHVNDRGFSRTPEEP